MLWQERIGVTESFFFFVWTVTGERRNRTFVLLKNLTNISKITCEDENSETSNKNVQQK